jgi:hypothetical protein
MFWEQILPVGRHLNMDGFLTVNWGLKKSSDKVNLLDLTAKLGSFCEEHADSVERSSRRPGVLHDGLALEVTTDNSSALEFVEGAIRLDFASKGFHERSDRMICDFSWVNDSKVKDVSVDWDLWFVVHRLEPGFPHISGKRVKMQNKLRRWKEWSGVSSGGIDRRS